MGSANDEDYGYEWYMSTHPKNPPSEAGRRCLNFLNWLHRGIYHDATSVLRVDWSQSGEFTGFVYRTHFEFCTYDSNLLTRLVVGAHDWAIRVSIRACNPRYLELILAPRVRVAPDRRYQLYYCHPTIEDGIALVRKTDPSVIYQDPPLGGS